MASDGEASCISDPNFAVICSFLEKFGITCGVTSPDFLELQEMLENTQEVSPELIDLHVKLLRKARKSVSGDRWERALIKLCHSYCSQDAWELERFGYKKARLASKLRILKKLLEMQFDCNQKFKAEVNRLTANELRTEPIGRDKHGHSYWYQIDEHCQLRVYREDPDEETWALVAKDRDGLVHLISQLSSNNPSLGDLVLNEDSNSLGIEKPMIDTGQTSSSSSNCEPGGEESSAANEDSKVPVLNKIKKSEPPLNQETTEDTSSNSESKMSVDIQKNPHILIELTSAKVEETTDTKQDNNACDTVGMDLSIAQNVPPAYSSNQGVDLTNKRKKSINELAANLQIKSLDQLCKNPVQEQEIDLSMKKTRVNASFSSLSVPPYEAMSIENALKMNTAYPISDDEEDEEFDDSDEIELPSHMKRARFDRPTLLGNRKKSYSEDEEYYGDEIEEPVMLVRGEGSGKDCENENAFPVHVGEEIEEPLMFFYGEGSGVDCDTGNTEKEQAEKQNSPPESSDKSANAEAATILKTDCDSVQIQTTDQVICSTSQVCVVSKNAAYSDEQCLESSGNLTVKEDVCTIKSETCMLNKGDVSESVDKSPTTKHKIGQVIIDVKSPGKQQPLEPSPVKKTSRWDVGKPSNKSSKKAVNKNDSGKIGVVQEANSTNNSINDQVVMTESGENSDSVNVVNLKNQLIKFSETQPSFPQDKLGEDITPKGNVKELVSKWEKLSENSSNNDNMTIEPDENPSSKLPDSETADNKISDENYFKKPLFYFGPGCFHFNSSLTTSEEQETQQQSSQPESSENEIKDNRCEEINTVNVPTNTNKAETSLTDNEQECKKLENENICDIDKLTSPKEAISNDACTKTTDLDIESKFSNTLDLINTENDHDDDTPSKLSSLNRATQEETTIKSISDENLDISNTNKSLLTSVCGSKKEVTVPEAKHDASENSQMSVESCDTEISTNMQMATCTNANTTPDILENVESTQDISENVEFPKDDIKENLETTDISKEIEPINDLSKNIDTEYISKNPEFTKDNSQDLETAENISDAEEIVESIKDISEYVETTQNISENLETTEDISEKNTSQTSECVTDIVEQVESTNDTEITKPTQDISETVHSKNDEIDNVKCSTDIQESNQISSSTSECITDSIISTEINQTEISKNTGTSISSFEISNILTTPPINIEIESKVEEVERPVESEEIDTSESNSIEKSTQIEQTSNDSSTEELVNTTADVLTSPEMSQSTGTTNDLKQSTDVKDEVSVSSFKIFDEHIDTTITLEDLNTKQLPELENSSTNISPSSNISEDIPDKVESTTNQENISAHLDNSINSPKILDDKNEETDIGECDEVDISMEINAAEKEPSESTNISKSTKLLDCTEQAAETTVNDEDEISEEHFSEPTSSLLKSVEPLENTVEITETVPSNEVEISESISGPTEALIKPVEPVEQPVDISETGLKGTEGPENIAEPSIILKETLESTEHSTEISETEMEELDIPEVTETKSAEIVADISPSNDESYTEISPAASDITADSNPVEKSTENDKTDISESDWCVAETESTDSKLEDRNIVDKSLSDQNIIDSADTNISNKTSEKLELDQPTENISASQILEQTKIEEVKFPEKESRDFLQENLPEEVNIEETNFVKKIDLQDSAKCDKNKEESVNIPTTNNTEEDKGNNDEGTNVEIKKDLETNIDCKNDTENILSDNDNPSNVCISITNDTKPVTNEDDDIENNESNAVSSNKTIDDSCLERTSEVRDAQLTDVTGLEVDENSTDNDSIVASSVCSFVSSDSRVVTDARTSHFNETASLSDDKGNENVSILSSSVSLDNFNKDTCHESEDEVKLMDEEKEENKLQREEKLIEEENILDAIQIDNIHEEITSDTSVHNENIKSDETQLTENQDNVDATSNFSISDNKIETISKESVENNKSECLTSSVNQKKDNDDQQTDKVEENVKLNQDQIIEKIEVDVENDDKLKEKQTEKVHTNIFEKTETKSDNQNIKESETVDQENPVEIIKENLEKNSDVHKNEDSILTSNNNKILKENIENEKQLNDLEEKVISCKNKIISLDETKIVESVALSDECTLIPIKKQDSTAENLRDIKKQETIVNKNLEEDSKDIKVALRTKINEFDDLINLEDNKSSTLLRNILEKKLDDKLYPKISKPRDNENKHSENEKTDKLETKTDDIVNNKQKPVNKDNITGKTSVEKGKISVKTAGKISEMEKAKSKKIKIQKRVENKTVVTNIKENSAQTVNVKLMTKIETKPEKIVKPAKSENKPPVTLMCVDITKLQEKPLTSPEKMKQVKTPSEISSPRSVESIGVDNDESSDIMDVPETDPLACTEEDLLLTERIEITPPQQQTLSLSTFKLDETDTALIPEPIARALRNRKIIAQAPPPVKKTRKRGRTKESKEEPVDNSGGKRMRLRGKRPVDVTLRRSIEKKKMRDVSSSDDDNGADNEEVVVIPSSPPAFERSNVSSAPKRGTGKARRGYGRGKGRIAATARLVNDSPAPSSDPQSETSRTDVTATPPITKTPGSRRKRVLGLDIDPMLLLEPELNGPGDVERTGRGTALRQSRRIAQLKIKEQAERRKLEEITLSDLRDDHKKKKKKKSRKDDDKEFKLDKKKRKQRNITEDEDESDDEIIDISKKKKHKKPKHQDLRKLFNISNPWQSSSGDSTSNEEEEEEVEEEPSDDDAILFKSDHEFSPESDLENNTEIEPLRRARTVKKESDTEEPTDEHACKKCSKSDHPEWILLCDKCDCGWHCSCLRPALLVIPEGDWFCPPCQHLALVDALKNELVEYDKRLNRHEMEARRKQRLAYVGISLDNVLPSKDGEVQKEQREDGNDATEEETSETESSTSSSSGDDSEPIYQLRERRQAHSYRFNDYDDLINSAIQDELEAVKGAGNQGRGKDIATIVNAEKEEAKTQAVLMSTQEVTTVEPLPPVVPVYKETSAPIVANASDEESDDQPRVVPKMIGRKKHRKLNSLDISSEDDPADDEDFKGTSGSDDEEFEDLGSEDSDELEYGRRGRRRSGPIRRSTRARTTRYDRDFINDDSDEDDVPRRKKTRSIWDESESEESDKSWGKRKRIKKQRISSIPRSSKKSRKKKKRHDDSDPEAVKFRKTKKPKIKFGGLEDSDEEELLTRRTRGKKINYIDALGSDSEEDKVAVKKIESEDEYVVNEEDDEDLEENVEAPEEKESDSDSVAGKVSVIPKKVIRVVKGRPSRGRGRGKCGVRRPSKLKISPLPPVLKQSELVSEAVGEAYESESQSQSQPQPTTLDIPVIAANPDDLNEDEVGTMMMENEEYANKQLELMAIQLAKEKKKKEREAKKLEQKDPPAEPKRRGRKKKSESDPSAAAITVPPPPPAVPASTIPLHEQKLITPVPLSALMNPPPQAAAAKPLDAEMVVPVLEPGEIPASLPTVVTELTPPPPKRRGRGKGKKTLAAEAAAAAAAAATIQPLPAATVPASATVTTAANAPPPTINIPLSPNIMTTSGAISPTSVATTLAGPGPGPVSVSTAAARDATPPLMSVPSEPATSLPIETIMHAGKLGIATPPQPFSQSQPAPSVITRMLQSQPVSVPAQTFTTSANSMGQKYYGSMACEQPPRPLNVGQFSGMSGRGRVPSPYRQPPPITHYGVRTITPNSPHRLRSPGPPPLPLPLPLPPAMPQMFHSTHHPLDPSPSGGGPVNISISQASRDRNSPTVSSPLSSKGGPTPPPPPYSRASMSGGRFPAAEPSHSPGPSARQHLSFGAGGAHLQQQPSPSPPPPPAPPRPAGNFSPYHPAPPPNYHYGAYPPAPALAAADDALPPTAYQGSPYPDHYNTGAGVHSSEGSNSKPFDEEGSGEFGGLVSYFSSQREDDLDT